MGEAEIVGRFAFAFNLSLFENYLVLHTPKMGGSAIVQAHNEGTSRPLGVYCGSLNPAPNSRDYPWHHCIAITHRNAASKQQEQGHER